MPQLNPLPWFFLLMTTWMLLILISPIKISKFHYPNTPMYKTSKFFKKPWHWPWT